MHEAQDSGHELVDYRTMTVRCQAYFPGNYLVRISVPVLYDSTADRHSRTTQFQEIDEYIHLYQCRLHSVVPIPIRVPALQTLALPPLLLPEAGSITDTLPTCCYTHHQRISNGGVSDRTHAHTHTQLGD